MYAASPEIAKAEHTYRRSRASADLHHAARPRRWRQGRPARSQLG